MVHATFIQGVGNTSAPEELSRNWLGRLAKYGLGLDARQCRCLARRSPKAQPRW